MVVDGTKEWLIKWLELLDRENTWKTVEVLIKQEKIVGLTKILEYPKRWGEGHMDCWGWKLEKTVKRWSKKGDINERMGKKNRRWKWFGQPLAEEFLTLWIVGFLSWSAREMLCKYWGLLLFIYKTALSYTNTGVAGVLHFSGEQILLQCWKVVSHFIRFFIKDPVTRIRFYNRCFEAYKITNTAGLRKLKI